MKKVLLFAIALCCMMSAMAQKTTENPSLKDRVKKVEQFNRNPEVYTHKLDSLLGMEGMVKLTFQYDNQYNITKLTTFMYGFTVSTAEYFYDAQNRCIRVIETSMMGDAEKIEYSYDDHGWVSEEKHFELEGNDWIEERKIGYTYDNDGNIVKAIEQDYEDGIWVNDDMVDYYYQDGKLIREVESFWSDAWFEVSKAEFSYDSLGDLVEVLSFNLNDTNWEYNGKGVYTYDHNHNCVKEMDYDFSWTLQDWDLYGVLEYTYDLSVPASVIAGLNDSGLTGMGINNMLLSVKEISYDEGQPTDTNEFFLYYSAASGVGEITGASLSLWPNPAHETLKVQAEGLQQVDLFTLDGKHITTVENGFESINVSALTAGCYLLKATLKDGSVSMMKFVKE